MSSPIEQNTPSAAYWGPLGPYLPDFLDYLRSAGLSEKKARDALGQARHFLLWLKQVELDIESIDDVVLRRFRDHDCRCPRPRYGQYGSYTRRPRTVLSGARRLIQFFEELGRTRHPGECSTGFRLLEAFLSQLERDRYRPDTLTHYRGLCRHFIVWLHHSRIAMKELDAPVLDRFIHHDCLCHGFCRKRPGAADNRVAIERFAGFLAAHGVAPAAYQASAGTGDEELPAFSTWLRRHRGIQETTIRGYAREVGILLQEFDVSPEHYDAKRVRDVLMCRFGQISRSHAKRVAVSMRMYLRFLATIGACAPGLIGAVPTVRSWRLASLPRYRPPDEIERVVSACNTATAVGLRDRAILLLLARLALRAGDVAGLRLGDIDWAHARLIVCGKSKRSVGLPLPQDAGEAVLAYIEQARPQVDQEKLFLRVVAPHRPLSRSSVISGIVCRALNRAGIDNIPSRGAHLFRHSLATALVRGGASLEEIGTLLRHRSPDTTAIYAKTDLTMLQEVSQPWLGGVR